MTSQPRQPSPCQGPHPLPPEQRSAGRLRNPSNQGWIPWVVVVFAALLAPGSILAATATFNPVRTCNPAGPLLNFEITVAVQSLTGFDAADVIIGSDAPLFFDFTAHPAWDAAFLNNNPLAPAGVYTFDTFVGASNSTSVGTSLVMGTVQVDTFEMQPGTYELLIDPRREDAKFGVVVSKLTRLGVSEALSGKASFVVMPMSVLYVKDDASGLNNGSSWANAYTSLQTALAAAAFGTEIWVAAGTYRPAGPGGSRSATFQLKNGVTLKGGFSGSDDCGGDRDFIAFETILSGDLNDNDVGFTNNGENSYHVVTGSGTSPTAVLDGFTITGGNAGEVTDPNREGGGMYIYTGSPTLRNCTFVGNSALVSGGAVSNRVGGNPMMVRCAFRGNRTTAGGGAGGAITNLSAGAKIINCQFTGNTAVHGGAVYNAFANPILFINCVFSGNTALYAGGAVNNYSVSPTSLGVEFDLSTFSGNTAGQFGGGVFYDGGASGFLAVRNSVFWGNSDGGGTDESGQIHVKSGAASVTYSVIQGLSTFAGNGNIGSNPLFADANGPDGIIGSSDDNLRLREGSPAVDAGSTPLIPADAADLDGDGNTAERTPLDLGENARTANDPYTPDTGVPGSAVVDMGAYEFIIDCNLNGIPDDQDIASGKSKDLDANGVPDECVDFVQSAASICPPPENQWSCCENWPLLGPCFPQNGVPFLARYSPVLNALPGPAPDDALLDVTARLNSLSIIDGAKLHVTQEDPNGNLEFDYPANILVEGSSLLVGRARTIGAAGVPPSLTIAGRDSVYKKDPGLSVFTTASLTAKNVRILIGGAMEFSDGMSATLSGDLVLDGSAATSPFLAAVATPQGITPPPKLRLFALAPSAVALVVNGDIRLSGPVEVKVVSTTTDAVSLGGDFGNTSPKPSDFDWSEGTLTLTGPAAQYFEAAGIDLGDMRAGFWTYQPTRPDPGPHSNFAIGILQIGPDPPSSTNANVFLVNRSANTVGNGPCEEALYVRKLIVKPGSTMTLESGKLYYGTLEGEEPTGPCGPAMHVELPPTPITDSVPKNRAISLLVPPSTPSLQTALRVRLLELQHPQPPNAPCCPPKDFRAYELLQGCAAAGEYGSCARWVGQARTYLESQDNPGLGSFKAARLQCTPYYHDWASEGWIQLVGAEIIPSSGYDVENFAPECTGYEVSCPAVSDALSVTTSRWGDVELPYNPPDPSGQPNAIDIAQLVAKFKNTAGAPVRARAQIQPNLPELNGDISALDISAVVDAVKGLAYPFSGPCPCPSAVVCGATTCPSGVATCIATYGPGAMCVKTCSGGANDGQPCVDNNLIHNHCPGGTCGTPLCRDRCGRCQ